MKPLCLPILLTTLIQSVTSVTWVSAHAAETNGTNHWAFHRPIRPTIPRVRSEGALLNPIDAFIRARLAREGLKPAPEADRATLLRRVCLDLTGLPPSPAEVDAFLSDPAPDAYERSVERALASPHYGERWGRWWLDAARYADSNGYSIDSPRSMWPYRDWVVRALNSDLPFDQFTLWQLAGDLLPDATPSAHGAAKPATPDRFIATGFHRNTQVNHEGGIDTEQFRIESAMDRVNTTATVWLGLTLGCAQCHDHKYDPLTQRDYYRFFAFFDQQENDGHGNAALEAEHLLDLGTPEELAALAAHRDKLKPQEKELNEWIEKELQPRQPAWELALGDEARKKLKPEVVATLGVPARERNEFQAATVFAAFRDQDAAHLERRKPIDEFRKQQPKLPTTLVMKEHGQPRETYLMIKGDFTRRGEVVEAGVPAVLGKLAPPPADTAATRRKLDSDDSALEKRHAEPQKRNSMAPAATRLDLARWLVSPENPLTVRVIVNRLWQIYFGLGLVETENDFGIMGAPPSHPELLDWLATELVARGWSLKAMHRLIVTSTTYRQASGRRSVARGTRHEFRTEAAEFIRPSIPHPPALDPLNKLLARQNRLRLDAEWIRDVHLAASGLLEARLGGPPVFPPQPDGLDVFTQHKREWKTSAGGDRYRRALYTHLQRTRLHPALGVFDAPDAYTACTRRLRSNTPLQALTLLNDQQFLELAQGLAARVQAHAGDDPVKLAFAFRCCLARKPQAAELDRLRRLLAAEREAGSSESTAWLAVARVVLNLDETITRE